MTREKEVMGSKTGDICLRSRLLILTLAASTVLSMTVTIFYAYNSSLEQPHIASLVARSPGRSILILNALSQFTLFFLAELTTCTMDVLRWALASSTSGTSAFTFLTLSRATSLLGAMFLSVGSTKVQGKFERNGHRIWGMQR
jgi:hypothetical protein